MTLFQFNMLDEMEQIETLWDKGVSISEREDEVYNFILYQIDSFYIEVRNHKENNELMKFRTFNSIDQLYPYIDKMNLKGLK